MIAITFIGFYMLIICEYFIGCDFGLFFNFSEKLKINILTIIFYQFFYHYII